MSKSLHKITMHYTTYLLHRQMKPNIPRKCIFCRYPTFRKNPMSLPELTLVTKLQENDTFCKSILLHIHCSKNNYYFTCAIGILHKKFINFNSTFSGMAISQILIQYSLHTSHDSLGHVGATKLYHFLKRLFYFQGMR